MGVISKRNILLSRDSKGKVRVVEVACEWYGEFQQYLIHRSTGVLNGKRVVQPDLEITKGKAKRSITEQATLEYNSLVKGYLDKGYKDFGDCDPNSIDINKDLPAVNTDTNGVQKPMLCKVIDFEDSQLLNKTWIIEQKHDGVRSLFYYKDGKVHTASRGGQDYDVAAQHIIDDPVVQKLFQENPNIILDGELYRHGWPLERISGLCRLDNRTADHDELSLHVYDIMDEKATCRDRYKKFDELKEKYVTKNLVFVPFWVIEPKTDLQELKNIIMEYHDMFTSDGYEGAVIRDIDQVYKCGGRDRRMQKIKIMQDAEYQIVGLSEGLREEDMAFEMVTPEGYPFKAKPEGNRALKHWYHEHIKELIGKMGTVRFFHMSNTEHPVPNLPVFVSVRDEKDMDS